MILSWERLGSLGSPFLRPGFWPASRRAVGPGPPVGVDFGRRPREAGRWVGNAHQKNEKETHMGKKRKGEQPSKSGDSLHRAIKRGAEAVRAALAEGADPNALNGLGETALHWAAFFDATGETVPLLVAAGADVNASIHHGYTPLHTATAHMINRKAMDIASNVEVARRLVLCGADAGIADDWGLLPLHHAALHGMGGDLLNLLIAATPNLDARTKAGETALEMAANHGNFGMVDRLVAAGAAKAAADERHRLTMMAAMVAWRRSAREPNHSDPSRRFVPTNRGDEELTRRERGIWGLLKLREIRAREKA